jgi:quercetin dioxygenase-like cupin family protein
VAYLESVMAALKTIHLDDLGLVEIAQEDTDMEVGASFPFSSAFPASTGLELEGDHTVVYFELEPGRELGTHEDSAEELVVCLAGEDIEAWAGDAEGTIGAGDLLVIPAMATHGFRNTGSSRTSSNRSGVESSSHSARPGTVRRPPDRRNRANTHEHATRSLRQ